MLICQAKQFTESKLRELKLPFKKLTARTVYFTDLARGSCVFVKIHGWKPSPLFGELSHFAAVHGFRITTDYDYS